MSLRSDPVLERVELPDGRPAVVRVGVPEDSYVPAGERDSVGLELRVGDEVTATLVTVLDVDQVGEGKRLARRVAEGLSSGELEPTAGDLEPLAQTPPA